MSYNKFINNSYCVGGKHYSPTTNVHGEITNTGIQMGRPVHTLRGNCVVCNRNKSLIVSERTINAERLGDFFKHLGSAAKNVGKKILNNPARALEIAANIGTAAASKNPLLIAATAPDVIKFVHQGKGLYKAEALSGKGGSYRESYRSKAGKAAGNASGSKAANTSNTNRKARTNGKGLYLGKIH